MKIGVIVHSQTGNTLRVAECIQKKLLEKIDDVELIRIKTIGDVKNITKPIVLDQMPSIEKYDAIVFGAWIQGFNLHAGMKVYISQLSSLKDKKITCFVTQYFPYKWMGGTIGLSQLKKLISLKDGIVNVSGIVNWSKRKKL